MKLTSSPSRYSSMFAGSSFSNSVFDIVVLIYKSVVFFERDVEDY